MTSGRHRLSRLGHVPAAVMNMLSLLWLAPACQPLIKSSPHIVLIGTRKNEIGFKTHYPGVMGTGKVKGEALKDRSCPCVRPAASDGFALLST